MWGIKIQTKKFRDFHVASTKAQRDATFQYFEEIQKEPEGSF